MAARRADRRAPGQPRAGAYRAYRRRRAATPGRSPAQDLKRIRLIDAELEAGLNKLGVRRYEQIAAWMQPDVKRVGEALGLEGRINQENWIEQAQVLAKGGETHYATRARARRGCQRRADARRRRAAPDRAGRGKPAGRDHAARVDRRCRRRGRRGGDGRRCAPPCRRRAGRRGIPPDVSERAAFAAQRAEDRYPHGQAAPAPAPDRAVPIRPAAPAARDNLQRISGIDAEVEKLLTAQGVSRYSQIAHWSPADVERFDRQLGRDGRIGRENWIEQAQILSRGGDTAFSRDYDAARDRGAAPATAASRQACRRDPRAAKRAATAAPAPADLGALRSVRSEAYQNAEPGPRRPSASARRARCCARRRSTT